MRYWRHLSPSSLFVGSFALLIALGTLGLLVLPGLYTGTRLGVIDALFTITSGVCVTGLVVVDTGAHFTFWGQLWILVFIQLGGLGVVTLSSAIIGMLGHRLSLRSALMTVATVRETHGRELARLTWAVTRYIFAIEAAGTLLLWAQWAPRHGVVKGLWHAVFHAVSATCNAGFSTHVGNLVGDARRPGVLITISALIVLGGLGYLAIGELVAWWRAGGLRGPRRLSTHTYAVVWTTAGLLVAGTALLLVFEWRGVLAPFDLVDKVANAWFMSVTPRTAGFNAVGYGEITNASGYLCVLLMFVGGSPGSTAGGVKTTALAVVLALGVSRLRGRRYAEINHRAIPDSTVQRAVSLTLLSFILITACVFVLCITETHGLSPALARQKFLPLIFEAVSAFGTVGLSMDLTPALTSVGKLVIIALMFIGRVGPLTLVAAIALRATARPAELRPAREDLVIG